MSDYQIISVECTEPKKEEEEEQPRGADI